MAKELLTYKDIMAMYGKSAETVWRWMRGQCFRGDVLPRQKDKNGRQYVLASDMEAFAARNGLEKVEEAV